MNSFFVVDRNTNLLTSAKKYGKSVKAIAVTGSINAITMGDVEDRKRRVMSNTEWLPVSKLQPPYHPQAPYTDTAVPAHPRRRHQGSKRLCQLLRQQESRRKGDLGLC
jgi:hypothetical protein